MNKAPNYLTYPKQFTPYKWYKPLLVALLALCFYLLFSIVLSVIAGVLAYNQGYDLQKMLNGGYDTLDAYSPLGAVLSLGSVALILPALRIGNRIVNARPFSSYSSSRGGFNKSVFFKCFCAALVLVGLPLTLLSLFLEPHTGHVKFTTLGFILCTVLLPLQCAAEEYMCRGFLMQMFGSWIKFPVIPILLQTAVFAALHPYNLIGVISVAVMGAILGVCAVITRGLESSCALHIVNNMTAFYLAGFGFGGVRTEVQPVDLLTTGGFCCLYLLFIIFADRRFGWFDHIQTNEVTTFNERIAGHHM